ncbi:hypothetical protein [Christiangramia crocea]|uniref:Uncharacterized protein n=1 Tax=Christiangramia crocea TaxID=2904124 RepID=A0A9X2A8I5_9FLAO|nr:hypothetical protein [Gramella crocea]MCG9971868.1 hypothetical protein [Gramella crocea]
MEFFRKISVKIGEEELQNSLQVSNLEEISTNIFNLDIPGDDEVYIGGIWGEFTLRRTRIRGGIRFALLECPNALCWTVTTGITPESDSITIHLTVNRPQRNSEFIEEVEDFLNDHSSCLEKFLSPKQRENIYTSL